MICKLTGKTNDINKCSFWKSILTDGIKLKNSTKNPVFTPGFLMEQLNKPIIFFPTFYLFSGQRVGIYQDKKVLTLGH